MMPRDWTSTVETLEELCRGPVLANESMANHISFRTGGPVRAFAQPGSRDGLTDVIRWIRRQNIPMVVIGAGSNVLWADQPYAGVVISTERALSKVEFGDGGVVHAGAGVRLHRLMTDAKKQNLGGFSFLVGIPGMVGGAVRMNAGTQLGSMADILESVEVFDVDGNITWRSADDLDLAYRSSNLSSDDIVLTAKFTATGAFSTEERDALEQAKNYRKATQPLRLPSGGSIFKNPDKHAAGALIEKAGLKGRRVGGAQVSDLHANWIVQDGSASSEDIRQLIREIQAEVFRIDEIWLEPELRFLGPWEEENP
jgi:UDP-N-acetylmuramate dehydrogenase